MGLDAFVNCNCYKEGKAKPFSHLLQYDEDGYIDVIRIEERSKEEYTELSNLVLI